MHTFWTCSAWHANMRQVCTCRSCTQCNLWLSVETVAIDDEEQATVAACHALLACYWTHHSQAAPEHISAQSSAQTASITITTHPSLASVNARATSTKKLKMIHTMQIRAPSMHAARMPFLYASSVCWSTSLSKLPTYSFQATCKHKAAYEIRTAQCNVTYSNGH